MDIVHISDTPVSDILPLGASPADWQHWAALGLTTDLLPVVSDPAVPIDTERSTLGNLDGKTPSQIINGKAVGVAGWAQKQSAAADIARWSADGRHGIGCVGRRLKAIDIDIEDPVRAAKVRQLVEAVYGRMPARTRPNSGKCLLLVRCADEVRKRIIKTEHGNIEILGDRQQFLLVGRHKSDVRYEWADGLPGLEAIPELSADDIDSLATGLAMAFGSGDVATEAPPLTLERPRALADVDDPDIDWLDAEGWVTQYERDGRVHVRCPWEDGHSSGDNISSTTYLPAGVGGQQHAGFSCLHASCKAEQRDIFDFRRATGLDAARTQQQFVVTERTPQQEAADAAIRERNAQHRGVTLDEFEAYLPDHKYINRNTREMWPAASVDGAVKDWPPHPTDPDKRVAPSKWLDKHRPVLQQTRLPGAPQIIEGRIMLPSGWMPHAGARVFNTYLPPLPMPGNATQAGPWLEHLRAVYPNEWPHLLSWFAHRAQRPGEKVNHALVLGGDQGVGKDSLLVPLRAACGGSNVEDVSPGALMGAFNGFVASTLMVVSEARDLGEADRFKLYEHCKTLIAAPPDVLRVNRKHTGEFYVPNLTSLIFTTNHRTSGLYLPADDRRHFVAWSDAKREQFGEDYFRRLYAWYEAGGLGHVVALLNSHDLSGFDPKAPPGKTPAFWTMVAAGEAPESSELRDVLSALKDPRAVTVAEIADCARAQGLLGLADELTDRRARARVPHALGRVGYVFVQSPDSKDGRFGKFTIYSPDGLSHADRVREARDHADVLRKAREPRENTRGARASDFA